jgi:hypothetical protein
MFNTAYAASTPVAVSFSANTFTDFFDGQTPPTDPVSGSFSFVFDDSGLNGVGLESKSFAASTVDPFFIDGAEYNNTNTGIEAGFIDGILSEINFGGLVGGIAGDPLLGTNDFTLMLLGGPSIDSFIFEQMRYTSTNFPNTDFFETTSGVAQVTTIPIAPAIWLFGSGLLGLIGIARGKKA